MATATKSTKKQGGARPGAGRPRGSKTNVTNGVMKSAVKGKKGDPLDLLLKICDDIDIPLSMRMNAATSALPYLRPKLSAQTVELDDKRFDSAADVDNTKLKALAFPKQTKAA